MVEIHNFGHIIEFDMAVCDKLLWGGSAFVVVGESAYLFGVDLLHSVYNIVHNIFYGDEDGCVVEDISKIRRKVGKAWLTR